MARRNQVEVASEVLRHHGIPFRVERTKRHDKVLFELKGREHLFVVSRSPSDVRAEANCRCSLRRILRSLGVDA